jgi:hypothetical protein
VKFLDAEYALIIAHLEAEFKSHIDKFLTIFAEKLSRIDRSRSIADQFGT